MTAQMYLMKRGVAGPVLSPTNSVNKCNEICEMIGITISPLVKGFSHVGDSLSMRLSHKNSDITGGYRKSMPTSKRIKDYTVNDRFCSGNKTCISYTKEETVEKLIQWQLQQNRTRVKKLGLLFFGTRSASSSEVGE